MYWSIGPNFKHLGFKKWCDQNNSSVTKELLIGDVVKELAIGNMHAVTVWPAVIT